MAYLVIRALGSVVERPLCKRKVAGAIPAESNLRCVTSKVWGAMDSFSVCILKLFISKRDNDIVIKWTEV